jgi:hypothetical protein
MKSRYITTHRQKLQRKPRSTRLYGSFEDSNKWYKCWNCKFVFDITKLSLGDGSGITVTDTTIEAASKELFGDPNKLLLGIQGSTTLLKLGADGNPVLDYYSPAQANATAGCPNCGTKNLP